VLSGGGLLAGRQLATGQLDQGFLWLSSVLQKMLNWYLHVSHAAQMLTFLLLRNLSGT